MVAFVGEGEVRHWRGSSIELTIGIEHLLPGRNRKVYASEKTHSPDWQAIGKNGARADTRCIE